MFSFSITNQRGITLIETIVIVTVLIVLVGLTTINITPLVPKAEVRAATDVLVADIKQQQLKAMAGTTDGQSAAQAYGVYLGADQYVLFTGDTYSASDPLNRVIDLAEPLSLTSEFTGNVIVFARGSGEIVGFTDGVDTIFLTTSASGLTRNIVFNRYGVITGIN